MADSTVSASGLAGMALALVLVVALIVALGWLLRRVQAMSGGGARPDLRVVATLALGVKERVVVVAVGDRHVLLGLSGQGMVALGELEHPLSEAPTTPSFAALLTRRSPRGERT